MYTLYNLAQLKQSDLPPPVDDSVVLGLIGLLSTIAGILSLVFVIIGAIRLAASGGSPDKIKKARQTILYAIIGLVVSISAVAIVSLVAGKLTIF